MLSTFTARITAYRESLGPLFESVALQSDESIIREYNIYDVPAHSTDYVAGTIIFFNTDIDRYTDGTYLLHVAVM